MKPYSFPEDVPEPERPVEHRLSPHGKSKNSIFFNKTEGIRLCIYPVSQSKKFLYLVPHLLHSIIPLTQVYALLTSLIFNCSSSWISGYSYWSSTEKSIAWHFRHLTSKSGFFLFSIHIPLHSSYPLYSGFNSKRKTEYHWKWICDSNGKGFQRGCGYYV